MDFDFSQLDKLPEDAAKKPIKAAPKYVAKAVSVFGPEFVIRPDLPRLFLTIPPRPAALQRPTVAVQNPAAASAQPAQQLAPAEPRPAAAAAAARGAHRLPAPQGPNRAAVKRPALHPEPEVEPLELGRPADVLPSSAPTPRGPKRPRKQPAPVPAADEAPGRLAIEPPTAAAARGGRGRRASAKAAEAAAAEAVEEPAADAIDATPKRRGRPCRSVAGAAAASAKPRVAKKAAEEGDDEGSVPLSAVAVEEGETAPKLFKGDKKAAKAAARRVGVRRPAPRRRRHASSDDEATESEELISSESEAEEGGADEAAAAAMAGLGGAERGGRRERGRGRPSRAKAIAKPRKPRKHVPSLADQPLDPENMTMRDIVRWGNARDRRQAMKDKIERQKAAAAAAAAAEGADGEGGAGAGPSSAGAGPSSPGPRSAAASAPNPAPAPAAAPAPQVQVIDGRVVVNRQSLTVQAQEKEQYTRIVTEDTARLNSLSYMNRLPNERWSAEDTELFYRALSQFGTDFTLITNLFPGRERRHIKNKYTRENKLNPERVDAALQTATASSALNSYRDIIVMLKEAGAAPAAPAETVGGRGGGGGDGGAAALPLAITEAGEPGGGEDEAPEKRE